MIFLVDEDHQNSGKNQVVQKEVINNEAKKVLKGQVQSWFSNKRFRNIEATDYSSALPLKLPQTKSSRLQHSTIKAILVDPKGEGSVSGNLFHVYNGIDVFEYNKIMETTLKNMLNNKNWSQLYTLQLSNSFKSLSS